MNNEEKKFFELTPFKMQVIQSFPFIDEDFDALTNYELLCKVVDYLNKTVSNVDLLNDEIQEFRDYFNTLDVQEEIDNKLDKMAESGELGEIISRYLTPIIEVQNQHIDSQDLIIENFQSSVNNEINTFKNNTNATLDSFDDRLSSLASGAPIPVSSTSDMTDTTKVYLLTTDGNWYYYDGEDWTSGGTYQATNVSDGSIDVLKLSSNLQNNFLKYYDLVETFDHYTNYFCKVNSSNKIVTENSTSFCYDVYDLTINNIYQVTGGINYSNCIGIIVADSSDNVIYSSETTPHPNDRISQQLLFRANSNNLKLYVSYEQSGTTNYQRLNFHQVYVLNNVYLNDNFNFSPNELYTYENGYGSYDGKLVANNGSTAHVYNMQKGRKYTVTAENKSSIAGLLLMSYDLQSIIYRSSSSSVSGDPQRFTYEFTASQDGLIIISTLNNTVNYSINISKNVVDNDILLGKTISCDGDSIMKGNENSQISYYDLIISKCGMVSQTKNAMGGATIATGTQSSGVDRHWISSGVLNINTNSDYIIINGGHNDYASKVPLGEITETFTDAIDSTTFAGGMELLCRNLLNRFTNGQKILFVFNHNINATWYTKNSSSNGHTFEEYYNIQIAVLKKYGIPYIDLIHESQLNTILDTYKTTYTVGDGIHPNTSGYNKFYVDKISSKLKEL